MNNITSSTEFSLPLGQSPLAMKKIILISFIISSLSSAGQLVQGPNFELGVGYALRHTEGFGIPKFYIGVNNLFNGLGAYISPEYRSNITFIEDGTDYYFRIPMGLTFDVNENIGMFAGVDPISFFQGKNLRKEVGLAFYTGPLTIRTGYSYWVGATIGFGYRFGQSSTPISFQSKGAVRGRKSSPSALPEREVINRVDTIVVREEVIKEVPVEVIKEVVKPLELTQIAVLYFEFNSTTYTRESQLLLEEVVKTIKANPSEDIVLIGHTDEVGTDAYNYTLGLNRAQKLANFLVNRHGVNSSLIEVRSEGLKRPFSNDDPNKNRRVVVYFKR